MKIIITGGTGLIGSNLVRSMARENHEIYVLTRSPQRSPDFPENVTLAAWDAKSVSDWIAVLEGADAVVNLAGENLAGKGFFPTPWSAERREKIVQSRIKVGQTLTKGIRLVDDRPDVLIQASAINYYGTDQEEVFTEDHPPGSDFLARTCVAWEKSTAQVVDLGLQRVVIRLGMVLSAEGGALPRLLLPFRLFLGGPFGSGEQWYSWIHIDDVSQAIQYLIQHPESGEVVNLTAPHPVKNREFAACVGDILSRPSFVPVPGFLMRWVFGDVSTVVLDGQRVIPRRLQKVNYQFLYPDLEGALRELLT